MSLVSNPAYSAKTPFKDTKSVSEYKSCNSHFTQLVHQIMSLWTVWNTLTFWDLKKAADSLEAFLVNFCNLAAEQQCWESGGFSTISLKIWISVFKDWNSWWVQGKWNQIIVQIWNMSCTTITYYYLHWLNNIYIIYAQWALLTNYVSLYNIPTSSLTADYCASHMKHLNMGKSLLLECTLLY